MKKIDLFKRIRSMLIDFCIICVSSIPFVLLIIIFKLDGNLIFQTLSFSFLGSLFLCKDLINGKSIGKRIVNLRIVGNLQSEVSPIRLILRNMFFFIWPVELIFCLINPEKKLGDIVFGTKVVLDEGNIKPIDIKKQQIFSYFIIVLTILFSIFYSILLLFIRSNALLKLLFA